MTQDKSIAGEAHGSMSGYAIGFALSIVLTAIPFALVMSGVLPREATLFGVFAAAAVQVLVHLHYFLHMDRSSSQRWNMLSFAFAALVIFIFIGGSLWIMYDLHYRMMG
jgi:cytochrome o ubiquinol oxidase subunit IV